MKSKNLGIPDNYSGNLIGINSGNYDGLIMGFHALLFCPDEKLSRLVTQVLSEVDFAVELVNDPFTIVKKLMAQHYDAVVVDCDNEQTSSLLFKSAHNSTFNQNSLAIAVVEGQAGVAKAYRIGANLVLTKPINVEQCKGTLRVARGLLRKGAEPAPPGAGLQGHSIPDIDAPNSGTRAEGQGFNVPAGVAPVSAGTSGSAAPVPGANVAVASMAKAEQKSAAAPMPALSTKQPASSSATKIAAGGATGAEPFGSDQTEPDEADDEILGSEWPKEAPALVTPPTAVKVAAGPQGTAAAPARAKEVAKPAQANVAKKESTQREQPSRHEQDVRPTESARPSQRPASMADLGVPTFAAFEQAEGDGSGGSKKIRIVAVAVIALAAAGYFGWTEFGPGKNAGSGQTRIVQGGYGQANPNQSNQTQANQGQVNQGQAISNQNASEQLPPSAAPASAESAAAKTQQPGSSETDQSATDRSNGSQSGLKHVSSPSPVSSLPVASPAVRSSSASSAGRGSRESTESSERAAPGLKAEPKQSAKSNAAPILVQSAASSGKPAVVEETPTPPSPVVTEVADNRSLSGLVPSEASVSKPTLTRIKLSQGVSQGLLIKRVQPTYPPAALAVHAQGDVQIEATINKEGNVVNPKVISRGDRTLAAAALEAVRQWRYKPYYLDGAPVEIQTQITIKFKAD